MYLPVVAIVSDEPAMYLYKQKTGALKARYDLTKYNLKVKGKDKFKLVHEGESQYRHVSNKFKLISRRRTDGDLPNQVGIIELMRKYTIS